MGSARVTNAKPIPMENSDKKSFKTIFISLFRKKKEKPKIDKNIKVEEKPEINKEVKPIQNTNPVAVILENFSKLNLEEKKPVENEIKDEEDDDLDNFTFKVIEEPRNERIHSQSSNSSEDSGFADNKDVENLDKTENGDKLENDDELENDDKLENDEENLEGNEQADDLADNLEKFCLVDECKKKEKKLCTVLLARTPIRNKPSYGSSTAPYAIPEDKYSKISSINQHALSGGQVIVNQSQPAIFTIDEEVRHSLELALENVQKNSQYDDKEKYLEDVMEFIKEDTKKAKTIPTVIVSSEYDNLNIDFATKKPVYNTFMDSFEEKDVQPNEILKFIHDNYGIQDPSMANSIDQISHEEFTLLNYVENDYSNIPTNRYNTEFAYPTPSPSEAVSSPISASPSSYYPTNSDYTLSPERSPISNGDYEIYQEISHFEEREENELENKKKLERSSSTSSINMASFKKLQKEIVNNLSKSYCCQNSKKPCKELFNEHLQKVKVPVRKNIIMELSKMDVETSAYGVLHHILIDLSKSSDMEDVRIGLFGLVCDLILAKVPALFVGDAGLSLLKAAVLRCPHKPLLTRYLVECIYVAIKNDPSLVAGREHVFHEVDALGDNLVIACARAGDRCAAALSELVRHSDPPLFRNKHTNADGYTALHVASSKHSAADPRLLTVHVLLTHAGLALTQGDLKGGDTALHLAVNSAHCDLHLILLMFNDYQQKEPRKALAQHPNLSSKTPLELARSAAKTSARTNYPREVFDFLKKCR